MDVGLCLHATIRLCAGGEIYNRHPRLTKYFLKTNVLVLMNEFERELTSTAKLLPTADEHLSVAPLAQNRLLCAFS